MADDPEQISIASSKQSREGRGKFLSDVFVRVLAQLFSGVRGLIYIPIIAKAFGARDFGIWAQIIAVSTLLVPLCTMRLETASVRYLPGEKDQRRVGRMIGTMLVFQTGVVFIGLIVGLSLSPWLVIPLFGEAVSSVYVVLLLALVAVKAFSYLLLYMFRAVGKIKLYSLIEVIQNIIQMIAMILVVLYLESGLTFAIAIFIATELLVAVVMLYLLFSFGTIQFGWEGQELRRYLRYSIPLMPNTFLGWVTNLSDRLVITWYLGIAAAGIYSTTYMLGQAINFMYAPIVFVLFPNIAKAWANKNEGHIRKYITGSISLYLTFCSPAVLLIIVTGPYLLRLLAGSEFVTDRLLIGCVAIGLATIGAFRIVLYVIHLNERTEILAGMFAAVAVANFVGNLILVPRIGLLGPAITTLVSYILQLMIVMYLAKRISKVKLIVWPPVWKFIVAASPVLLFLFLPPPDTLAQFVGIVTLSLTVYVALLFLLGVVDRREIRAAISTIPQLRRFVRPRWEEPQQG